MGKSMGTSNHMKIKVKVEDGKTVKVVDDNDNDIPDAEKAELDAQKVADLCRGIGLAGYQCVGVVLHRHASPGCVMYCSGGRCRKICSA